jgi:hypothetical protein
VTRVFGLLVLALVAALWTYQQLRPYLARRRRAQYRGLRLVVSNRRSA